MSNGFSETQTRIRWASVVVPHDLEGKTKLVSKAPAHLFSLGAQLPPRCSASPEEPGTSCLELILPGRGLPAEAEFSDTVGKGLAASCMPASPHIQHEGVSPGSCSIPLCRAQMAKQETPATIPLSLSLSPWPTLHLRCCDH